MVFELASTNLVIELGTILVVLMGWQFLYGIGGELRWQLSVVLALAGWAILPPTGAPADWVLVCLRHESGTLVPWMPLSVSIRRDDVVRFTRNPKTRDSGFMDSVESDLPLTEAGIAMFAVDEKNKHLYPLTLQFTRAE